MINYIALVCALAISAVAGYFSIVGLTAIFAGAFWPIIIMGTALEAGKLVTASWLYRNWHIIKGPIKFYLTSSVILLMFVTSMGIFGFLSKAHIDQTLAMQTGNAEKIAIVQSKIDFEKKAIEDLDQQISQIDNAINKLTDRGQANSSLNAADRQRKTRDDLVRKKEQRIEVVSKLTEEKIPLESAIKKIEAEVGPIKYIAQLIFEDAGTSSLERAVRAVIILLVIVFDPLAVVLLIAANIGLSNNIKRGKIKPVKKIQKSSAPPAKKNKNVVEIDKSQITNWYDKI